MKQYYTTAIFDPYNLHAVSDNLDRFWHEHVIDTARYSLLCSDIEGFMHHDPLDRTDLSKVSAVAQVYKYTRKVLVKIHGEDNLSEDFFPARPEMDILVCRHDVEPYSATWDDAFPIDKDIIKIKNKYGNSAKVSNIKSRLVKRK